MSRQPAVSKLPEHEGNTQVLRAFDVSFPSVGELKLNENNITSASAVLAHLIFGSHIFPYIFC